MHSRFDRFRATDLGRQLEAAFASPLRYAEFAALARARVASIVAVSDELAERFPELVRDTAARQFCGAMVAEIMRSHGHEVVQPRGRADGRLFTYGAVFSAAPVQRAFAALVEALDGFPAKVSAAADSLPKSLWARKPPGTGFALVEHVCHLRDLDAVYARRARAVLTSELPVLPSVDGTVLAEQRQYLKDDLNRALAAFRRSRRGLCARLRRASAAERRRCGLRDGTRRVNLDDLVREMAEHDATHALELDELRAELRLRTA